MQLERMDTFFNARAEIYDSHMLKELQLEVFYKEIAECLPAGNAEPALLDLGIGTGLELERLFAKFPGLKVTGIDISQGMLDLLYKKYPDKNITALCGSYFDIDFGKDKYDFALSTYSLHHFGEAKKTKLYRKVFDALRRDGIYVEGDYTCKTPEEQEKYIKESEQLYNKNNIPEGFYHYDIPFTAEMQMKLFKSAGFSDVKIIREWENTSIIKARK